MGGNQIVRAQHKLGLPTIEAACDAVADMYLNGEWGQDDAWANYPLGTFFDIRDKLDPWIKNIQELQSYDSVQFTREPQHPRQADPAYAFEVLYRPNPPAAKWSGFCGSKTLGVVNPFSDDTTIDTYLTKLFVRRRRRSHSPRGSRGPSSLRCSTRTKRGTPCRASTWTSNSQRPKVAFKE